MKVKKPTHRQTCHALAAMMLREPWADAVGWELAVSGSQFDLLAVTGAAAEEKWRRRLIGWDNLKTWARENGVPAGPPPKRIPPRVLIGEVKMSRQDLQAGIRRGQFGRYQESPAAPSHLLLVAWDEALRRAQGAQATEGYWTPRDTEVALADLEEMGVPPVWGVARACALPARNQEIQISVLRRPLRLHDGGDLLHRLGLAERMARSLTYRVLSPTSPEVEVDDGH